MCEDSNIESTPISFKNIESRSDSTPRSHESSSFGTQSIFKEPTTKELSDFIREILLPKINDLELEVTKLRRVTWPVCQKILEENQLDKIPEKKKFLKGLDQDEVKLLLKLKSNGSLLDHEYQMVTKDS